MSRDVPFLDASDVQRSITPVEAANAIEDLLRDGFKPESDPARLAVGLDRGQFLIMPSQAGQEAGVKVLTVAPGNAELGKPRIQGIYLLFDAETLTLQATMDGTALTGLRTAAMSMTAVRSALRRRSTDVSCVVFGAGPQAVAHIRALRAETNVTSVAVIGQQTDTLPAELTDCSFAITGTDDMRAAVASASVVVCATSARTPLFDAGLVRDDAVVIAIGSHEPDARELEGALLDRSTVVVEDVSTALRECGDVVMAVAEGHVDAENLITVADVISGHRDIDDDRPLVYKGSGMSWQDLVVASAVFARWRDRVVDDKATTTV